MDAAVFDLSEMQRYLEELQEGIPLDEVGSESYVKIIGKIREIIETPGLLDLIHIYQTTRRKDD